MKASVVSSKHLIKGLVLFTAMLGLSTSAWSDKPTPVDVVNTPNVNVVNTPSVNVANTPGVTVNNAASNPVPTTGTINAAPNPSSIVNLYTDTNQPQGACVHHPLHGFVVLRPDGTGPNDPFVVPTGKVFVITSLQYSLASSNFKSQLVEFDLYRDFGDPLNTIPFAIGVISDPNGAAAGTVTMPTGLVIKPSAALCLATAGPAWRVWVEGYLANDN